MSPITIWKSPPSALHSFSITASIFRTNSSGQSRLGESLSVRHLDQPKTQKKKEQKRANRCIITSPVLLSTNNNFYLTQRIKKPNSWVLRLTLLQIKKAVGTKEKFKSPSPLHAAPLIPMAGPWR